MERWTTALAQRIWYSKLIIGSQRQANCNQSPKYFFVGPKLLLKLTGEWLRAEKKQYIPEKQNGQICPFRYSAVWVRLCVRAGVVVWNSCLEQWNRIWKTDPGIHTIFTDLRGGNCWLVIKGYTSVKVVAQLDIRMGEFFPQITVSLYTNPRFVKNLDVKSKIKKPFWSQYRSVYRPQDRKELLK